MSPAQTKPKGRGNVRPPLTATTSPTDLRSYYWYLQELVAFARAHEIPASGPKDELLRRIDLFLRTGRRPKTRAASAPRRGAKRPGPLTVRTVVGDDFRCDAGTRAFFKSVIGEHFHFTAHLQQFRRERIGRGERLTYGDLAREWIAEHERRKDKNYKSELSRSWEYITFVRAFFADKRRNAGRSMGDAAKAWNEIRVHHGPRTYAEYVRLRARSRR